MLTDTVENYLKAIYVLQARDGLARTGALAQHLGITAGSVTEMIKRMAGMSPPLIDYRQHHGAVLTDGGRLAAIAVIRRHRLLETFLHRVLELDWEAVHEEAETLEHHLSERMLQAIDRYLGHPRFDPHGEPIPDAAGVISPLTGEKLTSLAPETAFRVVRVDPANIDMLGYLDQIGIGIDTTGVLVSHAPFGGPVSLRVAVGSDSRETAVGREVADCIYVVTT